ncbi:MAG: imelysin family protein [Pseudomonadota bacterium]
MALALVLVAAPVGAQERAFAPAVDRLVNTVIVPAYERFAEAASDQHARVDALCAAPSAEALSAAHEGFGDLVAAYAHIEPYRFGPARDENRYERLFFWPDRRGRGLRQVQRILAEEDESATTLATLTQKSVAVQGLVALEFTLFGSGSDSLAAHAGFRCAYARTVAKAMAAVGADMAQAWRGSFAQTLAEAGSDNPTYRSHGEVLQDILQAAATQLELAGVQKLSAVVGKAPDDAKPKRAPLWRSNLTLPMVAANVDAVRTLLEAGVGDLLDDDTLVKSALFELAQVDRALAPLMESGEPFLDLAQNEGAHRRLAYAAIPLGAAQRLIAERIQGALGLAAGFNALDGD